MANYAIAILGLALTVIFGFLPFLVPKMNHWIALAGVGFGILLIGFASGLIWSDRTNSGGENVRPLFDAFERHAAEELFLATALTNDIHLPPKDISSAQHTFDRRLLTTEERDFWREQLKKLDTECIKLGLNATHDAIINAIARFDSSEINRVTAYWAYHAVSLALKDEIARRGRIVLQ